MRLFIVFALLISSSSAFSFNWRRCKSQNFKPIKRKESKQFDLSAALSATTFDTTTDLTLNSIGSTLSYFTSTGPCKAFGMAEQKRIHYVAHTYKELQMELALGRGEYVVSMAKLYGCRDNAKNAFLNVMRANHSGIFNHDSENDPEYMTYLMTSTLADSEELAQQCHPEII